MRVSVPVPLPREPFIARRPRGKYTITVDAIETRTAGLIVHKGLRGVRGGYTLTHLRSRQPIWNFKSQSAAMEAALKLGGLGIDWTSLDPFSGISPEVDEQFGKILYGDQ